MGPWCFPGAGILLAAFLVVSASTLLLSSAHEDPSQSPSAPGTSALKGRSKESLSLLNILTIGGVPSSAKEEAKAPGIEGSLSAEAAGGPEASGTLSLEFPSEPAPLSSTGALGRATPGPTPLAPTLSAAHRMPESQPVSSVAGPAGDTLAPDSLETAAMLPAHGSGQKCGKASGLCVTVLVPASTTPRTSVIPRPTQQPAGASPSPASPAPTSDPLHLLWLALGRQIFHPSAWMLSTWRTGRFTLETSPPLMLAPRDPGKVVSSAPPGRLVFASMANTQAATEPLAPAGLNMTSPALSMGSGSSGAAVASGQGPEPSGSSVLPLPTAVPPPQPSSPSSPHLLSPASLSLSLSLPLSPVLTPISSNTMGVGGLLDPSVSTSAPSVADSPLNTSSLAPASPPLMAPQPAGPWGMVQPGAGSHAIPTPTASLSLHRSSSLPSAPPSSGSPRLPGGADPTQSPTPPHPGQDVSLKASSSSTLGHSHVTRSVTFRLTSEGFPAALQNPESLEHRLLSEHIYHQLHPIYQEAFPSFKGISAVVCGPDSADVNVSLVFGSWPGPSALEVLWTLYRQVKASQWMLGKLPLTENSLASDGSDLTDLALETVHISFTVMRPFKPQLLLPGSEHFVLLEKQLLHLVTPLVSEFYKTHPQEGPLLLFSDTDQWVSVYLEYKFPNPLPTYHRGLAGHLAHSITDPTLQKSSIVANGQKAELALYEMWLRIPGQPFTRALEDRTSPESQELRGQLTRWLTTVLRLLENFEQVVVEDFQREPLAARVQAAFSWAMPAQALVEDCVRLGLGFLQEEDGLWAEPLLPDLDTLSSGASSQPGTRVPSYAPFLLNFLLVTLLVLVLK